MNKRNIILTLLLIIVITCIAFLPSLHNGITNWDDYEYLQNNPLIHFLSFYGIKRMFNSVIVSTYVPLTILSFAVNYHFAGFNPFPYHLTNLILHLFNVILVFFFVYTVSRKPLVAVITALLFGIHPLRVESVAWISERKDVLYGLFFLSGLLMYDCWHKADKQIWYYAAFGFFILSFLSKPAAVSFPLVLLCYEYIKYGKPGKAVFINLLPFFTLAGAFAVITVVTQNAALNHGTQLWMNILIASHGLMFYLEKTIAPINLSCLYPFPDSGQIPISFLISPFILAGCAWLVVLSRKYTRVAIFGSLFFISAILPSLQILSVGSAIAADRYTYLPSIGLFYIAAEGFSFLIRKQYKYINIIRFALKTCLVAVVVILGFLTWQRCKVWKDSFTLWSDAIKYSPSNIAYNNLGVLYDFKGNYNQAISDFTQAIELNPQYANAYNNRGSAYKDKGDYDQAIINYTKAIELNPTFINAYYNRGNTYLIKKNYTHAISDYTKIIGLNPQYADAYNNRARCYYATQDYNKAWDDAHRAQNSGYFVELDLIEKLKKVTNKKY